MRHFGILIAILCFRLQVYAQDAFWGIGAAQAAQGNTTLLHTNAWSIFNNPAALARINAPEVSLTYQNRYQLEAFQVMGAASAFRIGNFSTGIGLHRFGDSFFNEQSLKVGVAHQLQMVSLGLGASVLQYHVETVGNRSAIVLDFGGIIHFNDQFSFAANVYNFSQSKLTSQELLPTLLRAGIAWQPMSVVSIHAEMEENLLAGRVFRTGLSYIVRDLVLIRTGFSHAPKEPLSTQPTFGLGLNPGRFRFDYAFRQQATLGSVNEFTLTYLLSQP